MKKRIPSIDDFVNENKVVSKPFEFTVQKMPYTMYNSSKNRYDVYRYDEDNGTWVITFFYTGKGKIDFRSCNADTDTYTRVGFDEIMYTIMRHLGIKIKSDKRTEVDEFIIYNT